MTDIKLPLTREQMLAIEEFMATCTVPILCEQSGNIHQIGTGTLFIVCDRLFLVTAKHVIDAAPLDSLSLPIRRGSELATIGESEVYLPKVDFDVAVLELRETSTVARLRENWRCLYLHNVGPISSQGLFIAGGYPVVLEKLVDGKKAGTLVSAYTERMPEVPIEARLPILAEDMFFTYGKVGISIDGAEINTPTMEGMSGASVWEYREPSTQEIWTPENCLRVTGVQISALHRRFFRALHWRVVMDIFRKIDDNCREAVKKFIEKT